MYKKISTHKNCVKIQKTKNKGIYPEMNYLK
jgi:hypothetical protein